MRLHELSIRELGPQGDGIHQGPRGRVYVERALPGERVRAELSTDDAGITRGQIVELLRASPERQKAPCPHYERCGGCTLQHLQPPSYRSWKLAQVAEALRRQGLSPLTNQPPVFVGEGSRRRATFSAVKLADRLLIGYYPRRSRRITPIDACLVVDPRLIALRDRLRPVLSTILVPGDPADVFLQIVGDTVDMLLTGPVGRRGKPDPAVSTALAPLVGSPPLVRIAWRAHEREPVVVLHERSPVTASFGPLEVALPPAAFLQPTAAGEAALVAAVSAALPAQGKFADLFSGCGTFAGPMLARGPVDAYESAQPAVDALTRAARALPLRAFNRDLFRRPLGPRDLDRYDAVVFDPPRAGCEEQAAAMAGSRVRTLIGVSCNPATFARDARLLCNGGYWLQSVQIVDQFVWSHHVELVGVFTRQRRSRR